MLFSPLAVLSTVLLSSLSALPTLAAPAGGPVVNVVFNPMITSPSSGQVWPVGTTQTITWLTSEIPDEEKNSTGTLILGYLEDDSEHLDLAHPLATGFGMMDGKANCTVPSVVERNNYIVVLFGDSGNASPQFTIKDVNVSPQAEVEPQTTA